MNELDDKNIGLLNRCVYYLINYSHINFYQKFSSYFPQINYIIAFCWALIQAILTYHFFPEILGFINTNFYLSLTLQAHLTTLAVGSTFITIFMIGLSVLNNKNDDNENFISNINRMLLQSNNYIIPISIILILVVTHGLAYGYIAEWANNLSLLLPFPVFVNYIICGFAVINLLFFSLERCSSSLDFLMNQPQVFSAINIMMFFSIHIVMFGLLGVFKFSNIMITLSAIIFVSSYFVKNYDKSKSILENIDNVLNDWIFLILHAVSEGAVVGAGIFFSLQYFIPNTTLLRYMVGVVIAASTVCEEMEDLVHDDDNMLDFASRNISLHSLYCAGYGVKSLISFGWSSDETSNYSLQDDRKIDINALKEAGLNVDDLLNLGFSSIEIFKQTNFSSKELISSSLPEIQLAKNGIFLPLIINKLVTISLTILLLLSCYYSNVLLYGFAIFSGLCVSSLALIYFVSAKDREILNFNYIVQYIWQKIIDNIIYFTCMLTALCVGINGGVEFYYLFSTNINIIILIAVAGLIVESMVYFDQIRNKSNGGDHGSIRILSLLLNPDNIIILMFSLVFVYSVFNLLFLVPGLSNYTIYSIVFLTLSFFGKELYGLLIEKMSSKNSKNMMLISMISLLAVGTVLNLATLSSIKTFAVIASLYTSYSPLVLIVPVILLLIRPTATEISIHNNCLPLPKDILIQDPSTSTTMAIKGSLPIDISDSYNSKSKIN